MSVSLDETIVGVSIRRPDLGAVGDGVTDDAPAFDNLASSLTIDPDELLIIPKGVYRIGSDVVITHPIYFHAAVLKPDAGVSVTLARSFEAGIARIFDGDGTVALARGVVAEAHPQWWGAAGDGAADDGPAVQAAADALAASGGELVFPGGEYRFAASRTLATPARLPRGAELRPDEGATVTLSGIEAGPYRVFGGVGSVAFAPGRVVEAYPQWWGAVGDGTTDAAAPVIAASNALLASGGELAFPAGFYRFASSETIQHPVRLLPGAELRPDADTTLTLTEVDAPFTQVFGGAGAVVIARGRVAEAYPQWWGAVGDGGVDDGPAIARAVLAMGASQGALAFPPGAYLISEDLTLGYPVRLFPGASLRPDFGVTLTLSGVEAPLQRVFAGAGTVAFAPGRVAEVYPQWWGAAGDGAADDAAAISTAAGVLAASGGELVFPSGAYRLATSQALESPVRLLRGARLLPDDGTTLTLSGIEAGLYPVFGGDGMVSFAPGTVAEVYPQWWGAVGDGSVDAAPAVAAAEASLAFDCGGELVFPRGSYTLEAALEVTSRVRLATGAELLPGAGVALTLAGGFEAPLRRVFGGEGSVAFAAGTVEAVHPQWWGALADGEADDAPALEAALDAVSADDAWIELRRGSYRLASSLTAPRPVRFRPGARLLLDAGTLTTFCGPVEAGLWQIFGGEGGVAFEPGMVAEVVPQWWGAVADGVTDDAPAFRQASAALTSSGGGRLFVPAGTYLFDSGEPGVTETLAGCIIGVDGVHVDGAGPRSVIQAGPGLDATGDNSNFLLELQGDVLAPYAAARRDCTVSNLRFVGRGVTFPYPSGVHGAPYSQGLRVIDCEFENLGMYGATDHSSSWNGLVTGCVSRKCATAHHVSGTTITHTVVIAGNRTVNCWNAVTVQFGAACTISDNAVFFDAEHVTAPVANMITSAILVMGQKGCVVKGNTIDARKANAVGGVVIPVGIQVGGNYGTADDLTYGYGRSCLVSENVVLGPVSTAILLAGAQQCIVSENQLGDSTSTTRPTNGVTLRENALTGQKSLRNQVHANTIVVYTSAGVGICEVEAKTGDNEIRGNDVVSAPSGSFILANTTAPVSRIFQNRGYLTEASGEASIAAAATSVTVNPGISETLVRKYIRVTPINSMNAAVKFRVTNVTATTFDIAVDVVPGLSGASFSWAYQKT
jgi:polygalacturonase